MSFSLPCLNALAGMAKNLSESQALTTSRCAKLSAFEGRCPIQFSAVGNCRVETSTAPKSPKN
eukprot:764138-Amphidinium_carterae.1